jgi:hypothetical protein
VKNLSKHSSGKNRYLYVPVFVTSSQLTMENNKVVAKRQLKFLLIFKNKMIINYIYIFILFYFFFVILMVHNLLFVAGNPNPLAILSPYSASHLVKILTYLS